MFQKWQFAQLIDQFQTLLSERDTLKLASFDIFQHCPLNFTEWNFLNHLKKSYLFKVLGNEERAYESALEVWKTDKELTQDWFSNWCRDAIS